jgi:predicted transcriptional regulator YdeE
MADRPQPVFRTAEEVLLIGTMAIYNSQAEASESIPKQWREFRLTYPALGSNSKFYGASPCTDDRKIHYLAAVAQESPEVLVRGKRMTLAAGEYAVVRVDDAALLRDTWIWLLGSWLPSSGRPDVMRRTRQSLSDLPASRGTAHPSDRSRFGFLSYQLQVADDTDAAGEMAW